MLQSMCRSTVLGLILLCGLSVLGGCDLFGGGVVPGAVIPGDTFATAGLVILDGDGNAPLKGTITTNKPDIYDLGPVAPGDHVIVEVGAAAGSGLDTVLAIFDDNEELFALNDDLDFASSLFDSKIDDFVTVASNHFYIAVARFQFSDQGGGYEGTVRVVRGGAVPAPAVQTLLLNFAGGPATIQNEGSFDLDPFDASDIDPVYAGMTNAIKADILATVQDSFADTGLQVVTSDANPVLTPGTFSTIHFGAFSQTKFGVADAVDQGNQDLCDDGIVFTNDFDDPFAQQPTAEGIAVAIANVASHEAGHLLGLNHVADIADLMDTTGTASTLLNNQVFKTSDLDSSIFPIGMQNGTAILKRVIP